MPSYASILAAYHRAHRQGLQSIVAALPLEATARVLDVPCGDGFHSTLLAEEMDAAGEVVSADVNEAFVALARSQAARMRHGAPIRVVRSDVAKLPFPDGTFDMVWCAQSLISLAGRDADVASAVAWALGEMRRVLRPGGVLGVLEYDELHHIVLSWPAELEIAVERAVRAAFGRRHGPVTQLEIGRHLSTMLRSAGFQSVRRATYASDRQWPLGENERRFVDLYLASLRRSARRHLQPDLIDLFDRLTMPDSPDYLPEQRDFEMTCFDMVSTGVRPGENR